MVALLCPRRFHRHYWRFLLPDVELRTPPSKSGSLRYLQVLAVDMLLRTAYGGDGTGVKNVAEG
jgi:hypothetical protein